MLSEAFGDIFPVLFGDDDAAFDAEAHGEATYLMQVEWW